MKKLITVGFGIIVLLTAQAAEASWDAGRYWDTLEARGAVYLDAYAELFDERPDDALEVLAAFNEVAYRVTGLGGLWRREVPGTFFGCPINDHLSVCRRFVELESLFAEWDEMQQRIEEIDSERAARRFLREHGDALVEYLEYYVPAAVNLSGVLSTPLFAQRIADTIR